MPEAEPLKLSTDDKKRAEKVIRLIQAMLWDWPPPTKRASHAQVRDAWIIARACEAAIRDYWKGVDLPGDWEE